MKQIYVRGRLRNEYNEFQPPFRTRYVCIKESDFLGFSELVSCFDLQMNVKWKLQFQVNIIKDE